MLEEKMGVEFCKKLLQEKSLLLAQLTDQFGIYFNINQIDPFEGYFSINLKDNNGRSIYDASFTFYHYQLPKSSLQYSTLYLFGLWQVLRYA